MGKWRLCSGWRNRGVLEEGLIIFVQVQKASFLGASAGEVMLLALTSRGSHMAAPFCTWLMPIVSGVDCLIGVGV
jgi:hypothetical protein